MMYDKHIKFKWSTYDSNEWCINLKDFTNKKYTYYWEGIPIRTIQSPTFTGEGYFCYVGLINDNYSSQYTNVDEIQELSDIRNNKIEGILNDVSPSI